MFLVNAQNGKSMVWQNSNIRMNPQVRAFCYNPTTILWNERLHRHLGPFARRRNARMSAWNGIPL